MFITTNIDTLKLSFISNDENLFNQISLTNEFIIHNITLKRKISKNKYYEHNYDLYIDDRLTGELNYKPFNPIIPNYIHFTFLKYVCYEKNVSKCLQTIISILNLDLNNISRLDVARDFINHSEIKNNLLNNYYYRPKKYFIYSLGKRLTNINYSGSLKIVDDKVIDNKSIYFGSEFKKICIYDKLAYLKENPDLFLNSYFSKITNDIKTIERLEIRLFNQGLKKYKLTKNNTVKHYITDIDLTLLDDDTYLNNLYEYYFNELLQIKYVSKKRVPLKDCKNVKFLNIDRSKIVSIPYKTQEWEKSESKKELNQLKRDIEILRNKQNLKTHLEKLNTKIRIYRLNETIINLDEINIKTEQMKHTLNI